MVGRDQATVRSGPGSWFAARYVLGRGARVVVLESKGGWARLNGSGWVSETAFAAAPQGATAAAPKGKRAPASVAVAAVRGFALRFGRAPKADVDALAKAQPPFFRPEEYAAFKAELAPGKAPVKAAPAALASAYAPQPYEEGIGLSIAAAAAAKEGLDPDPRLRAYLNMVATALAESSGAYDYPFKVYLTRSTRVNALAVPGGTILVSGGLLAACADEAELAAAIGHEMTHVLARHGLKEIAHRDVKLRAEDAMGELDAAAGRAPGADEEGLQDFADAAYDAANKPRLAAYEEEADRGAAVLLARAGYDPRALPRMIRKAGESAAREREDEGSAPFARMDFDARRRKAEAFLDKELGGASGKTLPERFQQRAAKPGLLH
jgi:Zn-dependent protease with chaperone function